MEIMAQNLQSASLGGNSTKVAEPEEEEEEREALLLPRERERELHWFNDIFTYVWLKIRSIFLIACFDLFLV